MTILEEYLINTALRFFIYLDRGTVVLRHYVPGFLPIYCMLSGGIQRLLQTVNENKYSYTSEGRLNTQPSHLLPYLYF